ncbi:VWA domain-containing protein [Candidatus Woesearchaeota archaeon]|nr:MAG: VWA domain-containing protein [Candidatus Woesearchaeota archaeon]
MRSVIENDQETIDEGKIISESISQGLGGFTPDLLFNNLVKNFQRAKKLYGATIIREVTDFEEDYIEKNLNIPEFKATLKRNIERNIAKLKEKGLLDKEGQFTQAAYTLASIILYTEELDKLRVKGLGEHEEHIKNHYGEKKHTAPYKKGARYRDIALKSTLRKAIRRSHRRILPEDLTTWERKRKGNISIIYALDASGSMRGKKLSTAKKAGIALAFKTIQEKNKAGLLIFSSIIEDAIPPTQDFLHLLTTLAKAKASKETDLTKALHKAIELFPKRAETNHLIILSDAIPTKGKNPTSETRKAASLARSEGITISLIGIGLDERGERLAKDITTIGNGRLYITNTLENLDTIILQEYDTITAS